MCAVTAFLRAGNPYKTLQFILDILLCYFWSQKLSISGCKSLKLKQLKLEPKDEKVHIVSLSDGVDHLSVK